MSLVQSSIGRKMLMGVCGLIWTGFVFVHMAGNLFIFAGSRAYNEYGHAATANKIILYGAEALLLFALIGHVVLGLSLFFENRKAAPQKYKTKAAPAKRASLASQTMAFQGSIILFFIIYHLITFKYGPEYVVTYDGVQMRDLFRLLSEVFQQPAYVFGYVLCLLLLGWHLSHGVSSVFQTLGFNHPKYNKLVKCAGITYAVVVVAGFISQPVYIFFASL